MPKTGRGRQFCPGQVSMLMPFWRDRHGRFCRARVGTPCQWMAYRRDARGRFACLIRPAAQAVMA